MRSGDDKILATIHGVGVVGGVAKGTALVSRDRISINLGVDEKTGLVVERFHELEGQSISGRVLVFPGEKGSGSSSLSLFQLCRGGIGPAAIVNVQAGAILAAGAAMANLPLIHRLDGDPLKLIRTGDLLLLDGDLGIIKILSPVSE